MGTYSHSQLNKFLLNQKSNVKSALEKITKNGYRTIFITDSKNKLIGTVSDGDIRKNLLKAKIDINSPIIKVLNKDPIFFEFENINQSSIKKYKTKAIDIIPIVKKNIIIDLLINDDKNNYINKNFSVIIMAGGLGSRLKPYTNTIPKPLMPYKNKSLLQNIIDQFININFKKIFISVNYKKSLIKTAMSNYKKKITYIEEPKSLGTAGSLRYLKNFKANDNIVVINCDVLLDYDLNDIFKYHLISNNDVTVVTAKKKITVPYGICIFNKSNQLKEIKEKPQMYYDFNIGFYIFKKNLLNNIELNEKIDMDDFLLRLIKKKIIIKGYSLEGNLWKDYGDLAQMKELIE